MAELREIIEESFTTYAGMVLQSRALVDVRDCIKPSARQIFYSMLNRKLTHDKPHKKTANAVGMAMADYYLHGDSSCLGIIMRAGQNFYMRYPLVEVKGNVGTLMETENWAASRYTESRLGALSDVLFADIGKNTITEWRDSYDNTKQFPAVLPSKGFYNLVNGTQGIGVGAAASIPQFNLTEMNNALTKLLLNPDIADDEILILPDFATGGLLLNAQEVKESLKRGTGKACKLRAVVEYDKKDNCLVVTEIPYGVYTNTICGELEQILLAEDNPGIDRFNDLTGSTPLLKIYLNKGVNYNKVLAYLYKNTSLQYWYAINMTMLDGGRYPRVFTWKEALQAHIDHEKEVYRRGFEYDRDKAEARLHIVGGLLIALASIEEVIETIKAAHSVAVASQKLQQLFLLDEVQASAVLEMKLSRLAHLEVNKLEQEKKELEATIAHINTILYDSALFNQQLVNGWKEVARQFGDARRTKVLNLTPETVEQQEHASQQLMYLVLANNTILPLTQEDKIKLNRKTSPITKQKVKYGFVADDTTPMLALTSDGKAYNVGLGSFSLGVENPLDFTPVAFVPIKKAGYLVTVSKKGIVKKSAIAEYEKVKRGSTAVKLREGDELAYAFWADNSSFLLLLGEKGTLTKTSVADFSSTGKATIGVKGIADNVIGATVVGEHDLIFLMAENKCKHTPVSELITTARGGVGQVMADDTHVVAAVTSPYYLVDDGTITRMTPSSLAIKGKTAMGAAITLSKTPIIVAKT